MKSAFSLSRLTATWRAVDIFCAVYLLAMCVIILLFPARVAGRGSLLLGNLLAIGVLAAGRWLVEVPRQGFWRFILAAFPMLIFIWMYKELASLMHVFHAGWFDAPIIELEYWVFGVDLNLWSERFISDWMTEWMLFGYLVYIPLVPIVGAALYFRVGPRVLDRYLLALALAYGLSFVVTMLLPVEGPQYVFAESYTRDLGGSFFRWLAKLLAAHAQNPTGAFPSPHAAAGTVMLLFLGRYHRPAFFVVLPLIVSFYLATVYGRYHYITDTVAGIVLATSLVSLAPRLYRYGVRVAAAVRRPEVSLEP